MMRIATWICVWIHLSYIAVCKDEYLPRQFIPANICSRILHGVL